jgi:hypothetical protein
MSDGAISLCILLAALLLFLGLIWGPRAKEARAERERCAALVNPFAKLRETKTPHAIYQAPGGWEWRVLKTYKAPENEAKDKYARWMVAAKSDNTYGSFEMGDIYAKDILTYGRLVAATQDWFNVHAARGFSLNVELIG